MHTRTVQEVPTSIIFILIMNNDHRILLEYIPGGTVNIQLSYCGLRYHFSALVLFSGSIYSESYPSEWSLLLRGSEGNGLSFQHVLQYTQLLRQFCFPATEKLGVLLHARDTSSTASVGDLEHEQSYNDRTVA